MCALSGPVHVLGVSYSSSVNTTDKSIITMREENGNMKSKNFKNERVRTSHEEVHIGIGTVIYSDQNLPHKLNKCLVCHIK